VQIWHLECKACGVDMWPLTSSSQSCCRCGAVAVWGVHGVGGGAVQMGHTYQPQGASIWCRSG
jgi:hypothetical protein